MEGINLPNDAPLDIDKLLSLPTSNGNEISHKECVDFECQAGLSYPQFDKDALVREHIPIISIMPDYDSKIKNGYKKKRFRKIFRRFDKNYPKLPKRPFEFFFTDNKEKYQRNFPEKSIKEIRAIALKEWQHLSEAESEAYVLKSEDDKKRFALEVLEYEKRKSQSIERAKETMEVETKKSSIPNTHTLDTQERQKQSIERFEPAPIKKRKVIVYL